HRGRVFSSFRTLRDEIVGFRPDFILMWGDDQYENFREDVIPPFCVLAYDTLTFQPFKRLGSRPNIWGEPADKTFTWPGQPAAGRVLARRLLEAGGDMPCASRPPDRQESRPLSRPRGRSGAARAPARGRLRDLARSAARAARSFGAARSPELGLPGRGDGRARRQDGARGLGRDLDLQCAEVPGDLPMKAVYIAEPGGPEKLIFGDRPDPEAGAAEVIVRVPPTSVNHADLALRAGRSATGGLPRILGLDIAGEIARLGPGVTGWKGGD